MNPLDWSLGNWASGDCVAMLAVFFVVVAREGWRQRRRPGDRRRR